MVRAPCCDKIGLKKGPWTMEEDQILTCYITKYGHGNWRALPKQADGQLAARLPGRTDNEVKNVWHTHLKKRVKGDKVAKQMKPVPPYSNAQLLIQSDELLDQDTKANSNHNILRPASPQHSGTTNTFANYVDNNALDNCLLQMDAKYWSGVFQVENSSIAYDLSAAGNTQVQYQYSPVNHEEFLYDNNPSMADDIMDYWFRVAALPEL